MLNEEEKNTTIELLDDIVMILVQVRAHPSERLRYCDKILPGEVTEYYFDM